MTYLVHEFKGEIDEDLQDAHESRGYLTHLMLSTVNEVAQLRRKEQSLLQRLKVGIPIAVVSPKVFYNQSELEHGQEVAAWLTSGDYKFKAGLFTQIVSNGRHEGVTQPELKVSADKHDGLVYSINDKVLIPTDQLELVTSTIETVELIRLDTQLQL